MDRWTAYNAHIDDAHQHLLQTTARLLLACGEAPTSLTEKKLLTIIQVIELIEREFDYLTQQP